MSEKTSRIFLILIFLSVCFTKVVTLPVAGQKIQLTEMVFLLFAPFLFSSFLKLKSTGNLRDLLLPRGGGRRVDILPFILLAAVFLSALAAGQSTAWFEFAGLVYLVALHWAVRLAAWPEADFQKWIKWMGGAAAVTTLASLLLHYSGLEQAFGWELTDQKYLPGFGMLARAEGLTMSPNQLADILVLALIVHQAHLFYDAKKSWDKWTLLLLAGAVCTFSKMLLLLVAGLLLLPVFLKKSGRYRTTHVVLASGFILFFLINTHILWLSARDLNALQSQPQSYVGEAVFFQNEKGSLVGTTYLDLKISALRAVAQHPVFGIGGGNFIYHVGEEQKAGLYPANLPAFDPHSTIFGLPAEQGLIVFLVFCGWIFYLFRLFWKTNLADFEDRKSLVAGLTIYFTLWLINCLAMDTLNARHFWLALGAFLSVVYFKNKNTLAAKIERK